MIDVLPTCLELAGAEYPQTFQEHDITPVEGLSLSPILKGQQRDGHPALFFEHEGGKAMITDGWKLVQPKQNGQWELYHLAEDRTETNNLADAEPQRLAQMKRKWQAWFNRVKP